MSVPLTREVLISAQKIDQSLVKCFAAAAEDSKCGEKQSYLLDNGVLMVSGIHNLMQVRTGVLFIR